MEGGGEYQHCLNNTVYSRGVWGGGGGGGSTYCTLWWITSKGRQ